MRDSEKQDRIRAEINKLVRIKKKLSELNVVRSEKIVSDIGEWFFTAIYGGERADRPTQEGWDVKLGSKKIQIKTHARGNATSARYSVVGKFDKFDKLVIIVFTNDFFLKEFYFAPANQVERNSRKRSKRIEIDWDQLKKYKIPLGSLPKRQIVRRYMA